MKITLLGSLGNINQFVIPRLVASGHEVTVISTNEERKAAIEKLGAKAAIGTMKAADFLTQTFTGQDTVYLMISGGSSDIFQEAKERAAVFVEAIQRSGVKNVVDLSSVGAESGPEAGALYAYHLIEERLNQLSVNIAYVRPVAFYNNLFSHLQTIQSEHAIYTNLSPELTSYYSAPADIAEVILPLLENTPAGHTIHYAISDTFSLKEFAEALKQKLGWKELPIIEITDDQYRAALQKNHIPESIIDAFIQMTAYQRNPEEIYKSIAAYEPKFGQVKLDDFIEIYAKAVQNTDGNGPKAQTIISK
jgi:uncharacterized protein YbjT (DUF2867 family)